MFTAQLSTAAHKAVSASAGLSAAHGMFTGRKPGTESDFGIGGMLVMSDEDTGLGSETLTWRGLPNLLWIIDGKSGLNLFYVIKIVSFADGKSHEMQQLFEGGVYSV